MKRREFLLAVGALAADGAQAQSAAQVARVAYLSSGTKAEISFRSAANEGLRALGWIEGRNLLIEERYAETRTEDLPRLVADLLRFKPDVIVCFGPTPAMALKTARVDIPIVFVVVWDPIRLGWQKALRTRRAISPDSRRLCLRSFLASNWTYSEKSCRVVRA